MNIIYSGDGIDVTPGLRAHTEKKFEKLSRHFDFKVNATKVIFKVEKNNHIAEATLQIPGQPAVHARAASEDLYHSISELSEKLDGMLKKKKEKITDHHHERPSYTEETEASEGEDE